MSIVATVAGLVMILLSADATVHGTGVSIVLAVNAYWFVSGSAKQVATEVVKQVNVAQGVAITAAVAAAAAPTPLPVPVPVPVRDPTADTQKLPKLPPTVQP